MSKHNIYLHDICVEEGLSAIAARKSNQDRLDLIESVLAEHAAQVELSIDDGYASARRVLPLLDKYEVRCTVFITTGFMRGERYPYELELSRLLESLDSIVDLEGKSHDISTQDSKHQLFYVLHGRIKPLDHGAREGLVNQLFELNSAQRSQFRQTRFLDDSSVVELAAHPMIEIGSHSHSHLYLPGQNPFAVLNELRYSKRILETLLAQKVEKIAYPYGGSNRVTRLLSRAAGYREGFGTDPRPRKGNSDPFDRARCSLLEFCGER